VVVIGKGKLIADTSIAKLLADNAHSSVLVRSPKLSQLQKVLSKTKASVTKAENSLLIEGMTTDDIGKLAFKDGLPIYELATQNASLESVFLELTAGAREYTSQTEIQK
jgi:ABC-2 type transport system ATP-binding protein